MHLKLDPKPLILSRKISQYCVTLITSGAISNPPCSICCERQRWTQVFQRDPAWLLVLMDSGQLSVVLIFQTAVNTLGTSVTETIP